MNLANLTDAELGAIVRSSPLWSILIEMEKKDSPTVAGQHQIGGTNANICSQKT